MAAPTAPPTTAPHGSVDQNVSPTPTEPLSVEQDTPDSSFSLGNALSFWLSECAWPGLGLFGESYLLFSIGTLKPLWALLFEDCFQGDACSPVLLHSVTYTVVLGVIFGMMLLGTLANTLGRRLGSILTATLMALGSWGLTLCSMLLVNNAQLLFRTMVCLLFVFGVGVGGEYPLSASSASERAMAELRSRQEGEQTKISVVEFDYAAVEEEDLLEEEPQPKQAHRGRRVQLVFTMQGFGIFFNCVLFTLLLLLTGQVGKNGDLTGNADISGQYDASALLGIWRTMYAVGAAVLTYVLTSRIMYLQESEVWAQDKERREKLSLMKGINDIDTDHGRSGEYEAPACGGLQRDLSDVSSLSTPSVAVPEEERSIRVVPSTTSEEDLRASELSLLIRNYGWRLFGVSSSWLLWDIAFYGNKLFQASFLLALAGDETTMVEMTAAATLNAFVALCGYFCAAFLIDRVGRLHLQQYGFLITGILFVGCGFFYDKLPTKWLVWMYLGSSFFGQCGPNATTFLIPAEIFPTEMRTMCHGIAAASGKVGALLAAVLFSHVTTTTNLFLWSGYASFTAAFITFCTIPETSTLNLYETDRRWRMILEGRKADYVGEATMPKYLSFYERQKLGLHY